MLPILQEIMKAVNLLSESKQAKKRRRWTGASNDRTRKRSKINPGSNGPGSAKNLTVTHLNLRLDASCFGLPLGRPTFSVFRFAFCFPRSRLLNFHFKPLSVSLYSLSSKNYPRVNFNSLFDPSRRSESSWTELLRLLSSISNRKNEGGSSGGKESIFRQDGEKASVWYH